MKFLLTADLHGNLFWYEWLISQAPEYDVMAVAGDLVHGIDAVAIPNQIPDVEHWLGKILETDCAVAVCSGNHEMFLRECPFVPAEEKDPLLPRPLFRRPSRERRAHTLFLADGNIGSFSSPDGEMVIISTVAYQRYGEPCTLSVNSPLWEEGRELKKATGALWFVLHHEPPGGGKVGGMAGSFDLTNKIWETQPDYVLSGHLHGQPFFEGGGFCDKIGNSCCFNPGQPPPSLSQIPNYIALDTKTRSATWHYFDIKSGVFVEERRHV